jgi:two-component system, chemotaxis family, chemotaxis protein CheY
MQLLLVDDSPTVRLAVRRMLAGDGVEFLEAAHGGEALDLLRRHTSIAAVLLDWLMPVMDGLTLLKTIRGDRTLPQPKIVMCTRQDDPALMTQALDHGADEYILKPFDENILRSKFRQVGLTEFATRATI